MSAPTARGRRLPAAAERSRELRVWAALAALPPVLALGWVGFLWTPALMALFGLDAGHYYSWRMSGWPKAPRWGRVLIFVTLHAALAWMCAGLFIGAALPLAQFALYALAITSFDLRTRGNLMASLGIGLLLLYVAATLERDYSLIFFALAYLALAGAVFYQAEAEDARRDARVEARRLGEPERRSRGVAGWWMGALASAGAAALGAAGGPLFVLLSLVGLAAAGWLLWRGWRQLRRERAPSFSAIDGDENRRRILAAYRAGQRRLRRYRRPWETPAEFARRVGLADWDEITLAAEQAAYRPSAPSSALARRVSALIRHVRPFTSSPRQRV
jgi:hypothetical protein